MNAARFRTITDAFRGLRIAVVGDFCLDRYLEIDPARRETSLETGLRVHNVVNVRSQPGGAGTILGNLSALGVGEIHAVGFAGEDGEGFELVRALRSVRGVRSEHFLQTGERRTFTYTKPLVISPGQPPVELNRLDLKNWSPTPAAVSGQLNRSLLELAPVVDAVIVQDQVDVPATGVVTPALLETLAQVAASRPELLVLADSRQSLRGYPAVGFKMNRAELALLTGHPGPMDFAAVRDAALALARSQGRHCFVTLAEQGILGASPDGLVEHLHALPVRGEIDIVGAGDATMASLAAALAAHACLREAIEIANAAASIVIHQLGTTGTAGVPDIEALVVRGT